MTKMKPRWMLDLGYIGPTNFFVGLYVIHMHSKFRSIWSEGLNFCIFRGGAVEPVCNFHFCAHKIPNFTSGQTHVHIFMSFRACSCQKCVVTYDDTHWVYHAPLRETTWVFIGTKPPVPIKRKQSWVNGRMENNRDGLQWDGGIVVLIGDMRQAYINDKKGGTPTVFIILQPNTPLPSPPPPSRSHLP